MMPMVGGHGAIGLHSKMNVEEGPASPLPTRAWVNLHLWWWLVSPETGQVCKGINLQRICISVGCVNPQI